MSSYYDRKTIAEAYDKGVDSYVVKPISYEEFARNLMDIECRWLVKYVG